MCDSRNNITQFHELLFLGHKDVNNQSGLATVQSVSNSLVTHNYSS